MYRLATISASELLGFCVNFLFDFWFLYHSRRRGFGYFQHFHWLGQLAGRTKSPMESRDFGWDTGSWTCDPPKDYTNMVGQNKTEDKARCSRGSDRDPIMDDILSGKDEADARLGSRFLWRRPTVYMICSIPSSLIVRTFEEEITEYIHSY